MKYLAAVIVTIVTGISRLVVSDMIVDDDGALRHSENRFSKPPKRIAKLMLRLDVLPPSLVMVQGDIESGWLQSRFARKGQVVFGQWTNSESGIKALDSEVRLAAFSNPRESLAKPTEVMVDAAYEAVSV